MADFHEGRRGINFIRAASLEGNRPDVVFARSEVPQAKKTEFPPSQVLLFPRPGNLQRT